VVLRALVKNADIATFHRTVIILLGFVAVKTLRVWGMGGKNSGGRDV
jgi:hypothetical protein